MARQVDPLVAFARKHHDRLFAGDTQASLDKSDYGMARGAYEARNSSGFAGKTRRARESFHRREDVNPESGIHKYGRGANFADPVNKKYPLDTPKHIHAAWSYIHMPKNAAKYDAGEVTLIKQRIRSAAKTIGMKVTAKSEDHDPYNPANTYTLHRLKHHPLVGDRHSHPKHGVGELSVGTVEDKPFHVKYAKGKEFDFSGNEYKSHLDTPGIQSLPINKKSYASALEKLHRERQENKVAKSEVSGEEDNLVQGEHGRAITEGEYDDAAVVLSLAKGRFLQTGPCIGDEYATIPRPGFSARDSAVVAEVLPNGMIGVDYTPYAESQRRTYLHRSELITQMRQEYIDLVKSASQQEPEEVSAGQICRKCKQNPISGSLPLSGYCDDCLTVSEHWW